MYPSIPINDIVHYTKMSALCVHMNLYEKYSEINTNFGGIDKGIFTS